MTYNHPNVEESIPPENRPDARQLNPVQGIFRIGLSLALLILFGLPNAYVAAPAKSGATEKSGETAKSGPPAKKTDAKRKGPRLQEKVIRVGPVRFRNLNRTMRRASPTVQEKSYKRGQNLARRIIKNKSAKKNVARSPEYSVRRIYKAGTKKLGADIISIRPAQRIFHINHIWRTLAGYINVAYNYEMKDARVLARFVLYYNARHRGRLKELKPNYQKEVIAALNAKKVGISRSYRQWPGRTQLLLPLNENLARPGKKDLDPKEVEKTGPVSKKEKKKLAKVQKKRKKENRKRLEKKAKKLKEETRIIKKKKDKIRKEIRKTEKTIKRLKKDPKANRNKITKATTKVKKLKKEEKRLRKKEVKKAKEAKKIDRAKKKLDKKEPDSGGTTNSGEKKTANKKKTLIAKIKKDIKKKQEEVSDNVVAERILFLRVLRYVKGGHYNNELWALDPTKNDTIFRGPFANICGRTFRAIPTGVVVVGYSGSGHSETNHALALLNQKTLRLKTMGTNSVFWRTPLIFRDGAIYAYELMNGAYYLSRFKQDLSMDARSETPINPDSQITFYKDKIYVTGKPKSGQSTVIHVFRRNNLKLIKTIEPGK